MDIIPERQAASADGMLIIVPLAPSTPDARVAAATAECARNGHWGLADEPLEAFRDSPMISPPLLNDSVTAH
jgi:hypothetical protein